MGENGQSVADAAAPATGAPAPAGASTFQVCLATLVGGLLRFWYVLWVHPPAKYLYSDMLANVQRAYAMADPKHVAGPWDTFVPRGIVAIGALALKLFPDRSVEALTPVQALLSTACIPLAFVGLRRFLGERPARWAAWMLALDYLVIGFAGYFLAETYLAFLLVLALALFQPDRPWRSLWVGLCLGLASWYKAQTFVMVPIWALGLWWTARKLSPERGRARRLGALAMILGGLAFVVPESVLVSRILGRPIFMSSNGGQNFYSGHCRVHLLTCVGPWGSYAAGLPTTWERDPDWPDRQVTVPFYDSGWYYKEGIRCLESDGLKAPLWFLQQFVDVFAGWPGGTLDPWPDWSTERFAWVRGTNLLIAYLIAPLAFLGLWWRRREEGIWFAFGLPLAQILGIAVLFLGDPRFRVPYDFLFFGAAASAMIAIWESERLRARIPWLAKRPGALAQPEPAQAGERVGGERGLDLEPPA